VRRLGLAGCALHPDRGLLHGPLRAGRVGLAEQLPQQHLRRRRRFGSGAGQRRAALQLGDHLPR
jgi:hypothetical protein